METLRLPGDKSIAHRALILAGLAGGSSRLRGIPGSADVRSTRSALAALGVRIEEASRDTLTVTGSTDWVPEAGTIDCGNSGTTARLLAGVVVGLGTAARLDGDESLRRRPMDRVVYPLQSMGGRISYVGARDRLPIDIGPRATGGLRTLRYRGRVASAQVKSALLLAGLTAAVVVEVHEPGVSRDHTERMLAGLGGPIRYGPIESGGARCEFTDSIGSWELPGFELEIPGDISSAAFLIAAALLNDREVKLDGVGLNPTRTAYLDVLERMGADVRRTVLETRLGEPVGTVTVRPAPLRAFEIEASSVPGLVDEIPVLAVLAAKADGTSWIRGATELRYKESDRLAGLADNLGRLGVSCRETADGLSIEGTDAPLSGDVRTAGDHRIAMAFAVLGRADGRPAGEIRLDAPDCVRVSYPEFWRDLDSIVPGGAS